MSEVKRFSLSFKEIPIEIIDPETARPRPYILREFPGAERDAWLNALTSRVRTLPNGKQGGIKNFTGMQADLISRCLFDEENKLVSVNTIQKWPASVQIAIHEMCQKLCGLDDAAEGEAKNDSTAESEEGGSV